jgi:hypothetical protein
MTGMNAGSGSSNILAYNWTDYDKKIKAPEKPAQEEKVANLQDALADGKLTGTEIDTLKDKFMAAWAKQNGGKTDGAENAFYEGLTKVVGREGVKDLVDANNEAKKVGEKTKVHSQFSPVEFRIEIKDKTSLVTEVKKGGAESLVNEADTTAETRLGNKKTEQKPYDYNKEDFAKGFGENNPQIKSTKEYTVYGSKNNAFVDIKGKKEDVRALQTELGCVKLDGRVGAETMQKLFDQYKVAFDSRPPDFNTLSMLNNAVNNLKLDEIFGGTGLGEALKKNKAGADEILNLRNKYKENDLTMAGNAINAAKPTPESGIGDWKAVGEAVSGITSPGIKAKVMEKLSGPATEQANTIASGATPLTVKNIESARILLKAAEANPGLIQDDTNTLLGKLRATIGEYDKKVAEAKVVADKQKEELKKMVPILMEGLKDTAGVRSGSGKENPEQSIALLQIAAKNGHLDTIFPKGKDSSLTIEEKGSLIKHLMNEKPEPSTLSLAIAKRIYDSVPDTDTAKKKELIDEADLNPNQRIKLSNDKNGIMPNPIAIDPNKFLTAFKESVNGSNNSQSCQTMARAIVNGDLGEDNTKAVMTKLSADEVKQITEELTGSLRVNFLNKVAATGAKTGDLSQGDRMVVIKASSKAYLQDEKSFAPPTKEAEKVAIELRKSLKDTAGVDSGTGAENPSQSIALLQIAAKNNTLDSALFGKNLSAEEKGVLIKHLMGEKPKPSDLSLAIAQKIMDSAINEGEREHLLDKAGLKDPQITQIYNATKLGNLPETAKISAEQLAEAFKSSVNGSNNSESCRTMARAVISDAAPESALVKLSGDEIKQITEELSGAEREGFLKKVASSGADIANLSQSDEMIVLKEYSVTAEKNAETMLARPSDKIDEEGSKYMEALIKNPHISEDTKKKLQDKLIEVAIYRADQLQTSIDLAAANSNIA